MTNTDLLKEIRNEDKAINRNIRRLINIGLLGLLGKAGQEAKEKDDETGRLLSKVGLLLIAINEVLLFVSDVIDYRKSRVEERLDESRIQKSNNRRT